jgi:SAM-dependent methyltransferase
MATANFPLVHASAEATGLADESFDIVFCDHGAMTWGDPYRTVPEASRLLRTGGLLAFSMSTPIADIAWLSGSDHPSELARAGLLGAVRDRRTWRGRHLPVALRRGLKQPSLHSMRRSETGLGHYDRGADSHRFKKQDTMGYNLFSRTGCLRPAIM